GPFLPQSVPRVLAQGEDYFVMEYLQGFRDWKSLLKERNINLEHAQQAGALMGKIHCLSFGDPTVSMQFDSTENFVQLRISPYLHFITKKHPDLAEMIYNEANRLTQCKECLIH